jgi:hypothetical protein
LEIGRIFKAIDQNSDGTVVDFTAGEAGWSAMRLKGSASSGTHQLTPKGC